MNKHKIIISISILLGCVILGGFYYASQINKQKSIEYQKQMEIDQENRAIEMKVEQENKILQQEKNDKNLKEMQLGWCLDSADEAYWNHVKLNGTEVEGEPGTYNAYPAVWNEAQKRKDAKEDTCFKQYK